MPVLASHSDTMDTTQIGNASRRSRKERKKEKIDGWRDRWMEGGMDETESLRADGLINLQELKI